MILKAKKIITGDGKTVCNDYAVYVKDGKIEKLAPAAELIQAYPNEEVKDYGDGITLSGK